MYVIAGCSSSASAAAEGCSGWRGLDDFHSVWPALGASVRRGVYGSDVEAAAVAVDGLHLPTGGRTRCCTSSETALSHRQSVAERKRTPLGIVTKRNRNFGEGVHFTRTIPSRQELLRSSDFSDRVTSPIP